MREEDGRETFAAYKLKLFKKKKNVASRKKKKTALLTFRSKDILKKKKTAE